MLNSIEFAKIDENIEKAHMIDYAIMNDSVESFVTINMSSEEIINFQYNITENND